MKYILFIIATLSFTLNVFSQHREIEWLKQEMVVLNLDTNEQFIQDEASLKKAIGNARIVLLGEETHGDGKAFETKVELIEFLHSELDFNVLAFESSLYLAEKSNQLLASSSDPVQMLRRATYPHWSWTVEVQPLLQYISEKSSSNRPLFVSGFDYQEISPVDRETFPMELFNTLKKLDISFSDQTEQNDYFLFYSYLSNSFYNLPKDMSPEILTHQLNVFTTLSEKFISEFDGKKDDDIQLLSKVLRDKVAAAPKRVDELLKKMNNTNVQGLQMQMWRDSIMAANIVWLKEERYPEGKLIIWAANRHIARNIDKTMGDYLFKKYGEDIYSIAFVANKGEWGTIGMKESKTISEAKENTMENIFSMTARENFFLDFRAHENTKRGKWLSNEMIMRPHGYLEESRVWTDIYDSVIFNNLMTRSRLFKK